MSGVIYGEDVGAIVLDIGTFSTRCGYAGDELPRFDVSTDIGCIVDENIQIGTNSDESSEPLKSEKYQILVNISNPQRKLEVQSPVSDGQVTNFELLKPILDYLFNHSLKVDPEHGPLIVSEQMQCTDESRENLAEFLFETYNIPAYYTAKTPALVCFSQGRSSGLVIDVGYSRCSVTPVVDGHVLYREHVHSPIAGRFLDSRILEYLKSMNFSFENTFTTSYNYQNSTDSWKNRKNNQVVNDFKESMLSVLETPPDSSFLSKVRPTPYSYQSKFEVPVSKERYTLAELLFNPGMIENIESSSLGVTNLATSSINNCDADIRPSLASNVIITGGTSLLGGFSKRLHKELSNKFSPNWKLKVLGNSSITERRFSPWVGASMMASLGTFQQLWISQKDYKENGKSIVTKKIF